MKLKEYKYAQRLIEGMDEFDKMRTALHNAAQEVKKSHKLTDSHKLALLISKLVETEDGERVVDSIVTDFLMRFEERKRKLQEMFDEL